MGIWERQLDKTDERAAGVTAPLLSGDEASELVLLGNTRVHWLLLGLAVFPIVFLLELNGYGGWNPLVIGFAFGAYFVCFVRSWLVVLTNRRVIVIRYKRMSTKRVDFVDAIERRSIREVNWRPRLVTGSLTLVTDEHRHQTDIPSAFTDRAEHFVQRVQPNPLGEPKGVG